MLRIMRMNFFFNEKKFHTRKFFIKKILGRRKISFLKKKLFFLKKNLFSARVYAHAKTFWREELVLFQKFFPGPDFKKVFLVEKHFGERS
jgi:hypothetical protein